MTERYEYLEKNILDKNLSYSYENGESFFLNKETGEKMFFFSDIPNFLNDHDNHAITKIQKNFYNEIKFPNYDDIDDYGSLIDKSKKNIFTDKLDKEISYNAKILEVGCGTGQLTNFLARYSREVYGIDLSKGSLFLAENFRKKNNIDRAFFLRMNVFNILFKKNIFDVVISNGVLHHTKDAKLAFNKIIEHLKPNGYVIIGLYHRHGRLYTRLIQFLVKYFGENVKFMDKKNIDVNISKEKRYAWFNDQYKNPHETLHKYTEVVQWFNKNNIEYISSIPFNLNQNILNEKIFTKQVVKKGFQIYVEELIQAFKFSQIREGGFFIMIGKKKV
jgi:2-polyprenyl-3-methyl-5-hydroxy-6-metoxy-1,4-benzoquinol methylase